MDFAAADELEIVTENKDSAKNASRDALAHIRKESMDIYNRLHSIKEDTTFVEHVAKSYPDLPLLPNLRCGAWYTDPSLATDVPAYFKSTDGHFSNWSFNLRRPNLHLLPLIVERKGMILVDSTRAGKKIPDALSKTVPIWCAVVNRAVRLRYPQREDDWDTGFYTPPASVSRQEHAQIASRINNWADELATSSYDLPNLMRPLRPLWVTPATSAFPQVASGTYYPVICVSASKQITNGLERRAGGYSYIQGSADDQEAWGMGLSPNLFWQFNSKLLSCPQMLLAETVKSVIAASALRTAAAPTIISRSLGRLLLCANVDITADCGHAYVIVTTADDDSSFSHLPGPRLVLKTHAGKKGQQNFLDTILPQSLRFIKLRLDEGDTICVSCDTGNNISAGIVLVALQMYFDDDGNCFRNSNAHFATKKTLHTRLEWIIADRPCANPSRSTLKRVNEFLLTPVYRLSRLESKCAV